MKGFPLVLTVVLAVALAVVLGFWLGFRQGWQMGLMIEAAPRGVVGMQLGRRIDAGHGDEAKYYFESQVDAGLMFWHDVSASRLAPYLNRLTGDDVYPEYEKYIRRLAEYRKSHSSPLWDAAMTAEVDSNLAAYDPALAEEMAAAGREAKSAMDKVVSEYAP